MIARKDDHQVGDHRCLALGVELNEVGIRELPKRHLHEADRARDHRPARREDRLGLLAAQHHLGDLGRVREMRQARLEDVDPGRRQAFLELGLQAHANFVTVGPQGRRLLRVVVVRVLVGKVTERGLALDDDELPEVLAIPVVDGSPGYLAWLDAELAPEPDA